MSIDQEKMIVEALPSLYPLKDYEEDAIHAVIDALPPAQHEPLQPWEVLAAQAVLPQPEIVRCKDCKYAEYIDDVQTLWCTECGQGRTVAPDDFCSYAGRREVTE